MADRLTQLQDCLDQLATQFYASIRYISNHHPPSALPNHPNLSAASPPAPSASAPTNQPASNNASNNPTNPLDPSNTTTAANPPPPDSNFNANVTPVHPPPPPPVPPVSFSAAQKELARDLLTKTRQITYLISVLPGVENSEKEQEGRIRALEQELREVEAERVQAVQEMEAWQGRLESVIGNMRR
ncbi:RNA polymerase II mediator complex subunit [Pseudocyphellaria aurata]|nr:RNA polymerase II mediator complex subunit [Pseudocyphellaria aurata]